MIIRQKIAAVVAMTVVAGLLVSAPDVALAETSTTQSEVADLLEFMEEAGGLENVSEEFLTAPATPSETGSVHPQNHLFRQGPQSPNGTGGQAWFRIKSFNHQEIDIIVDAIEQAKPALRNRLFAAADIPVQDLEVVADIITSQGLDGVTLDSKAQAAAFYPSDPEWPFYWGARSAFMPQAWGVTRGSPNVKIAILDTGVATNEDLPVSRVSEGKTFYPGHPARTEGRRGTGGPYGAVDYHGTLSATVAAGTENNFLGALGTCPRCSIIPVRVFSPDTELALFSDIAEGIIWATDNEADIISMSLGGSENDETARAAVVYARSQGVVLIASAGNWGDSYPTYPAAWPEVIGVAAHDHEGGLFDFSSRGAENAYVAAPGCIEAANSFNGVSVFCGTSASAPFVAGIAGLLLTLNRSVDVEQILAETSAPLQGTVHGKVNAHLAILKTQNLPLPEKRPSPRCGFRDVPANAYYAQAACWLKQEKTTTGFGGDAGQFAPSEWVTRAQMAAFLWRSAGNPNAPTTCGFRDVPANAYYARAACWLKQEYVTTGFGGDVGRFAPNVPVDRDQMAAFLWRAAGRPPSFSECGFRDVPTNAYYAQGACWLKANNVTTGFGGDTRRFAPLEKVTRAQMAAFLWRSHLR